MATWWASVSRRCETLFGDLSKRKLQPIQNKDLEVDHEQSFLFEVKPGRRQGTCMCTYQATLSECNRYFHTPATTTPSQTPVYRMSLCYTGTRGKTPEHNQAKHTKHPQSLEWHNSTIMIVFPSTHMYTHRIRGKPSLAYTVQRVCTQCYCPVAEMRR